MFGGLRVPTLMTNPNGYSNYGASGTHSNAIDNCLLHCLIISRRRMHLFSVLGYIKSVLPILLA